MGPQEFVRSLLAVERRAGRLNPRLRWRPRVLPRAPGCWAGSHGADQAEESVLTLYVGEIAFLRGLKQR